ncbi:hypothetical protein K9M79_01010 [Candidatus Woesearchaeota archaeon]|nr:hypothetical protein [Candidatus Woesearchaeota archaeon]
MKTLTNFIIFLAVAITLSAVAIAYSEMLVIEFTLSQAGTAELTALNVYEGSESEILTDTGDYTVTLLDADGKELYKKYFTPQFTAWADAIDPSKAFPVMPGQEIGTQGQIDRSEIQMILRVPMVEGAKKFQIRKDSKVLINKEINLCNMDGSCNPTLGENYLTCEDCQSGSVDDYCDGVFDDICDRDCRTQGREDMDTDCTCGNNKCDVREDSFNCPLDCGKPSSPLLKWGLIALIVLVIIVALIMWMRGKKKSSRARRDKSGKSDQSEKTDEPEKVKKSGNKK